jgi:hypothetical protein
VYRGLARRDTSFRRTPKYRLDSGRDGSWRAAPYRLAAARGALIEFVLGAVVLLLAAMALIENSAAPTGVAVLFGAGFLSVGGGSLAQQRTPRLGSGRLALVCHRGS